MSAAHFSIPILDTVYLNVITSKNLYLTEIDSLLELGVFTGPRQSCLKPKVLVLRSIGFKQF